MEYTRVTQESFHLFFKLYHLNTGRECVYNHSTGSLTYQEYLWEDQMIAFTESISRMSYYWVPSEFIGKYGLTTVAV